MIVVVIAVVVVVDVVVVAGMGQHLVETQERENTVPQNQPHDHVIC